MSGHTGILLSTWAAAEPFCCQVCPLTHLPTHSLGGRYHLTGQRNNQMYHCAVLPVQPASHCLTPSRLRIDWKIVMTIIQSGKIQAGNSATLKMSL